MHFPALSHKNNCQPKCYLFKLSEARSKRRPLIFLWLQGGLASVIIQCCVQQWWVWGEISRNFEFWKAPLVYGSQKARNLPCTALVIAQCSQYNTRCISHIKWLLEIRRSYLRCKSPTRSFNWEVSLSFSSSSCETFNRRQEKRNCLSEKCILFISQLN